MRSFDALTTNVICAGVILIVLGITGFGADELLSKNPDRVLIIVDTSKKNEGRFDLELEAYINSFNKRYVQFALADKQGLVSNFGEPISSRKLTYYGIMEGSLKSEELGKLTQASLIRIFQ